MFMPMEPAIAAIATPLGQGGLGVVRISGEGATAIADRIFTSSQGATLSELPGYRASYGRVADQQGMFDEAVALVFRAPHSYTGEDVVELSCHGGEYLVQRLYRACLDAGALPAGPGEFTRRAYFNGKLSLTQAEAVAEMIAATGGAWSRAALAARDGATARAIADAAQQLRTVAGHLAAWVDFPEEGVDEISPEQLRDALSLVQGRLLDLLKGYDVGRIMRDGVSTAIVGRPNVGKSTLMNLLSGAQRSIVTDLPGTPRDIVEERIRLGEITLCLADTAGLRMTQDPVEQIGVQRARQRLEESQLVLAVFDGAQPLQEEELRLLESLVNRPAVAVINKTDLPCCIDRDAIAARLPEVVEISALDRQSIALLEAAVSRVLCLTGEQSAAGLLVSERQRQCVRRALDAVQEALSAVEISFDAVTVCVDEALSALWELTGERVTDAVVDEVFSHFCVGK
jgi:tRNA modification GTPase